jgi:hypothetical protein
MLCYFTNEVIPFPPYRRIWKVIIENPKADIFGHGSEIASPNILDVTLNRLVLRLLF